MDVPSEAVEAAVIEADGRITIYREELAPSVYSPSVYYLKDVRFWRYDDACIVISHRGAQRSRTMIPWAKIHEVDIQCNSPEYIAWLDAERQKSDDAYFDCNQPHPEANPALLELERED